MERRTAAAAKALEPASAAFRKLFIGSVGASRLRLCPIVACAEVAAQASVPYCRCGRWRCRCFAAHTSLPYGSIDTPFRAATQCLHSDGQPRQGQNTFKCMAGWLDGCVPCYPSLKSLILQAAGAQRANRDTAQLTIMFTSPCLPVRYPDGTLYHVWNSRLDHMSGTLTHIHISTAQQATVRPKMMRPKDLGRALTGASAISEALRL